ncbi:MAG: methyl-accepting chemotaxis protein [Saccharospirillaceae bacterium]|nr:methyl-accepting chemotaxis protein [Saccharospirillaceae bacterium]MCD8533228.1 methyl-accepting chemotaxis protein [Saccharospirillaceae bacterium]
MRNSIRKQMMLAVGSTILVLLALSGVFTYEQARSSLEQAIGERIQVTGERASRYVSSWISNKGQVLSGTAKALLENEAIPVIEQGLESGNYMYLYLGTDTGDMIMRPDDELPADYDPRKRPWYQQAMAERRQVLTAPYVDASTNELIVTFAEPLSGGVIGGDISLAAIVKEVLGIELGESGYAALLDSKGDFMVHPEQTLLGKNVTTLLNGNTQLQLNSIQQTRFNDRSSLVGLYSVDGTDWRLLLVVDQAEAFASLATLRWSSMLIGIITIVVVTLMAGMIISYLLRPLVVLNNAMSDIAQGEADLTRRLRVDRHDEIGTLSHSFNVFVSSIHELVSQSRASSGELDKIARSARENAGNNNQAVQLQQNEISQVAVAVNELSSTSSEVATNASDTANAAQSATSEGNKGIQNAQENKRRMDGLSLQMDSATEIINQLDSQAQQITGILATIQGIAEQTNLLALNAAIEAARAGEQGRGFAVVADEVRTLSQRTHTATGEIQEMIDSLKHHSQKAVGIMETSKQLTTETAMSAVQVTDSLAAISEALHDISNRSQSIANASREQHAATEEISRIATAIQAASDDLAANVDQATQQSHQLHALSHDISSNLSRFRV